MNSLEKSLELDVILEEMLRHCSFSLGKKVLRETPVSYDRLVIRLRNERLREALACTVHYGPMPFYGVRDIREPLQKAQKGGELNGQELLNIVQFIGGVRGMLSYEKNCADTEHPHLKDLCSTLTVHQKTETFIRGCINEYGDVMDSASAELRGIRAAIRKADADIANAVRSFLSAHPGSVVDSIVTERSGRAVILIKASEKNSFGGLVYGDSASGQASYVEPASLMNANNRKQELISREEEEIHRILRACSEEVQKVSTEELANLDTAALLDSIFARASWGKENDAAAAELTEEKKIVIVKARHPLIPANRAVYNTYRLEDPRRVLLITGPNTGGKTVSMKIIGLFVLMTYAGMPVPCDEAVIPFTDRVFADIGDDQSVVSSLSNFSAHIQKQAEIVRCATGDSLVLLDEAGSGTDPREGESLAIAILNDLREKKCLTVATTHYGRLKTYGKRHDDILLASVQFDMKELAPTYRYVEGMTGQSNALEVAERYSLPKGIIRYARFLKNQSRSEEEKLIEELDAELAAVHREKEELEALRKENEALQKQLREEEARRLRERDVLRQKAEEEAEAYMEEVHAEADRILKEMREKQETSRYHEVLETRQELEKVVVKKKEETAPVFSGEYKVGDAVELRSSDQVCEVIAIGRKDITILMNGREIRVKKDQIRPSRHVIVKKKVKKEYVPTFSGPQFRSVSTQCNLIGMRVDEANEELDAYLDQVKLAGLKTCRIIHGDGSGALRSAVHARLKNDKAVKEFRLGMPSEGGTGATVVTMK
ncbi:MAG: endonuclease MutS2 [Solobacterium sp.]|nr:endonuclease MutS2 [Solobacterium sp.]